MIAIPIFYTIIGIFVFIVLQEIIGFWTALLTGLFWLPALIVGFIISIIGEPWEDVFLAQLKDYPTSSSDDLIDVVIIQHAAEATKFWLFWLIIGICYEVYAILTNKVDTLSERIWYWLGKYWILRVTFILFWVWAFIHIVFGPCAFGILCFSLISHCHREFERLTRNIKYKRKRGQTVFYCNRRCMGVVQGRINGKKLKKRSGVA